MFNSNTPGTHYEVTETTSGPDFRGSHLPYIHAALKLNIVNNVQVLTQMVFPVESPLLQRPLSAAGVITLLCMLWWWIL
jgi:hypothetical protein